MTKKTSHPFLQTADNEQVARDKFDDLFLQSPIPVDERLRSIPLYMNRLAWAKQLFFFELYQKILNVNGVAMEFGVRWGQNLASLINFRSTFEPYNHTRKIIGFDTFEGFPSVSSHDGDHQAVEQGALAVTDNYQDHLEAVLSYHESEAPISHIKKFELVKGDASITVPQYLEKHPETVIAFAYFDMDLYEPTLECIKAIRPHLAKGSIIGFDQLNCQHFPGETQALAETLGLNNVRLQRVPYAPYPSFIEYE